jgi:hypothetical protein
LLNKNSSAKHKQAFCLLLNDANGLEKLLTSLLLEPGQCLQETDHKPLKEDMNNQRTFLPAGRMMSIGFMWFPW